MIAEESVWSVKERAAWELVPRVGIRQWAEENVVLTKEMGVDRAGPYDPTITPWQLEIFKAYEDPQINEIVIVGPSQGGKSLAPQIIICYEIDCDPKNILCFMDIDSNARYVSTYRIQKVIDSCPGLADKVEPIHKRSTLSIDFDGGNLTLAGAKSVGQLGTKSAPLVIRDETSKWPASLSEEAGALELAGERKEGQGRYKMIDLSTPVMTGDPILKQFALSNQGYIHLPCPLCGRYQALVWKQMGWPHIGDTKKSVDPEAAKANTWYECIGCAGKIRDGSKMWMLANYKLVIKGQKIEIRDQKERKKERFNHEEHEEHEEEKKEKMDPRVREDDNSGDRWEVVLPGGEVKKYRLAGGGKKNRRWGIHFSRLYVPWRSWNDLAATWLEIGDDLSKKQNFYNACRAEPWRVRTLRVKESELARHIWKGMGPWVVPEGYEYITAGADIQQKEIYYAVWAWREDGARHLIEYGILPQEISSLDAVASMKYPVGDTGRMISVRAVYIDSRYRGTEVEDFCRVNANCYTCQGLAVDTPRQYGPVSQGWLKTDSKGRKLPQDKWRAYVQVHTASFKEELHTRFEIEWDFVDPKEAPQKYISFHADTEMELIEHLTAEERIEITDVRGRPSYKWVVKRKANHWLDATVYAAAAWRWNFTDWTKKKKKPVRFSDMQRDKRR